MNTCGWSKMTYLVVSKHKSEEAHFVSVVHGLDSITTVLTGIVASRRIRKSHTDGEIGMWTLLSRRWTLGPRSRTKGCERGNSSIPLNPQKMPGNGTSPLNSHLRDLSMIIAAVVSCDSFAQNFVFACQNRSSAVRDYLQLAFLRKHCLRR